MQIVENKVYTVTVTPSIYFRTFIAITLVNNMPVQVKLLDTNRRQQTSIGEMRYHKSTILSTMYACICKLTLTSHSSIIIVAT